jgi:hypothetical protein
MIITNKLQTQYYHAVLKMQSPFVETNEEIADFRRVVEENRERVAAHQSQLNTLRGILSACIASRVSMVIVTSASGELGLIFSSLIEYYGVPGGINRPPPYDIRKILEMDSSMKVDMSPSFPFDNEGKRVAGALTFTFSSY